MSYYPYPFKHYYKPAYALSRQQHNIQRPSTYPDVNTDQLKKSAEAFQPLMEDADKIIHAFSNSSDFAYNIMNAAQQSQSEKVSNYIKEIGVSRPIEIKYNPDGIRFTLINQYENIDCCELNISLQW